ncbi:hypothetical protein, partial [Paracoccus sp. (in: a-proteobacteria)]|uniref:hypothetical protein n=1 Tax=Paracoccus sp. TaxID=267 RepID=UPI003A8B79EB
MRDLLAVPILTLGLGLAASCVIRRHWCDNVRPGVTAEALFISCQKPRLGLTLPIKPNNGASRFVRKPDAVRAGPTFIFLQTIQKPLQIGKNLRMPGLDLGQPEPFAFGASPNKINIANITMMNRTYRLAGSFGLQMCNRCIGLMAKLAIDGAELAGFVRWCLGCGLRSAG